jgi:hypothetical protein
MFVILRMHANVMQDNNNTGMYSIVFVNDDNDEAI